jgi:molybdenum cofactor biosynthesis enzyme MoaA
MSKETYCKFPFKQLALKTVLEGNVKRFWPCCNMGNDKRFYDIIVNDVGDLNPLTPAEMFEHPRMEQLRENLKNGIRDPACSVCWDQEDAGLTSFREFSIKTEDDIDYNANLEMIDITISNKCNLRCRMCFPSNSHSLMIDNDYFEKNDLMGIAKEATGDGWNYSIPVLTNRTVLWEWILNNTDKIKVLKMSGGEPFYDQKTIDFLNKFIENGDAKNTELKFHTNGTQFTDDVVELLKQFKHNEHVISIDGVDETYEYIRYPGTFNDFEKSLQNYITNVNSDTRLVHTNFVVSSLNLLNTPDFISWTVLNGFHHHITFSSIRPIERGTAIDRLPVYILEHIKTKIFELYSMTSYSLPLKGNIIELIKMINIAIDDNKEDRRLMLKEIMLFDKSRNQSYRDYLDPVLVSWLDDEDIRDL